MIAFCLEVLCTQYSTIPAIMAFIHSVDVHLKTWYVDWLYS